MKRAEMETTVGDKGRQGAWVTDGRLRPLSFISLLKSLCQWAEADQARQADRRIIRRTYKVVAKGLNSQERVGTQMIQRFQPLLSNHCPKADSNRSYWTHPPLHSWSKILWLLCWYVWGLTLSLPLVNSTRWLANYSPALESEHVYDGYARPFLQNKRK